MPGIAIPFYLTHPRLMKLEKKMMLDVEGGTWSECMAILRHEAGHAVQHAYQLQRRRRWQQLFGRSSKRYPRYYRPNPASRQICPASSALVRAEPSGRGFRRNLRGVAAAALELADALCRLAGAEEARICRRTDGRDRREAAAGHDAGACRSPARAQPDAWRALPEKAGVLRLQATEDLRPRPLPAVFRRSTASPARNRLRSSSGGTAPRSGSWWRGGPARTSLRSMPCWTT